MGRGGWSFRIEMLKCWNVERLENGFVTDFANDGFDKSDQNNSVIEIIMNKKELNMWAAWYNKCIGQIELCTRNHEKSKNCYTYANLFSGYILCNSPD